MNVKELAGNLGLEEEEFLELFDLFIETGIGDLEKLSGAIQAGDAEQAVRAAHSIKGAAANLGLTELSQAAREIENSARDGLLNELTGPAQALKEELNLLTRRDLS